MLTLHNLIQNSDESILSYQLAKDTNFYKQISDVELEKTHFLAKKEDVYDGKIILKRNNKFYIDVGWDPLSNCNLFIPVEGYPLNIFIKQVNK